MIVGFLGGGVEDDLTETRIIVIIYKSIQEYNGHTFMKYFDWNDEKNEMLKKVRGVSFEQVELAIALGDLVDRIKHPNLEKYPNQEVFLVKIENYIYSVPYIEDNEKIFLKTIIPNSKATKKYFGGKK